MSKKVDRMNKIWLKTYIENSRQVIARIPNDYFQEERFKN